MKRYLPLLLLALTGCQTTKHLTVPCIGKNQALPAEPPKVADRLTGKADEDIRIIAGSNIRLRAYGGTLRQIIESCREH